MVSQDDMLARIDGLLTGRMAWDMCDWSEWTDQEQRDCHVLTIYEARRRVERNSASRRRARRLFASWLTDAERRELKQRRAVTVVGSAGGRYRLRPTGGATASIERRGTRWFALGTYCLHPTELELPHADIALAHLLLLKTDEPAFLREANFYPSQLWDGAWLRRLNAARRERAANPSLTGDRAA